MRILQKTVIFSSVVIISLALVGCHSNSRLLKMKWLDLNDFSKENIYSSQQFNSFYYDPPYNDRDKATAYFLIMKSFSTDKIETRQAYLESSESITVQNAVSSFRIRTPATKAIYKEGKIIGYILYDTRLNTRAWFDPDSGILSLTVKDIASNRKKLNLINNFGRGSD